MPREPKPWHGKATPPATPASPPPSPTPTVRTEVRPITEGPRLERPLCPQCGAHALRKLASGAWGCAACGMTFRLVAGVEAHPEPDESPEETPEALDTIEAINRMLHRNTLTLGTGGVPLAQDYAEAVDPRTRNGRRRSRRRS